MASPSTNLLPLSGDNAVDVITNGTRWILTSSRTVTWSISDGFNGEFWISPEHVIELVGHALDTVSYYADITFDFVGYHNDPNTAYRAGSNINISMDGAGVFFDSSSIWARGFFPHDGFSPSPALAGDVFLNLNSQANDLPSYEPGSEGWFLLLHELGHALGLRHTHDDGVTGRPTLRDFNLGQLDKDWLSVMSYEDDFSFDLIRFDPATPMLLDVIGLQYLYGKNLNTNLGNTRYELDTFDLYYTLWDAGGRDTASVANSNEGWYIQLPDTVVSATIGEKFGFALPLSDLGLPSPTTFVWIEGDFENATGSAYGDYIGGNELANRIAGGAGNDYIEGNDGGDLILGATGIDTLYGDNGADRLVGGGGHDLMFGGAAGDRLSGGVGHDTLHGEFGDDTLLGGTGSGDIIGGHGHDVMVGSSGNDDMLGGFGRDRMLGGSDSDWLEGGGDGDYLNGGAGSDVLLAGNANDRLIGGNGADYLDGGFSIDSLIGGSGNDSLAGGGGVDRFIFADTGSDPRNPERDLILDWQDGLDRILMDAALKATVTFAYGNFDNRGPDDSLVTFGADGANEILVQATVAVTVDDFFFI